MFSLSYSNDGVIGSKNYEWLQNATQHLCNLFRDCTGLKTNTEKTETMSCHPGEIRGRCSMEGYKRRHEGTGETYSKKKGKRTVYPLPSCGKASALGSIQSHLRTQHGIDACDSIITKPIVLAPRLYKLSFQHQSGHSRQVPSPVDNCRYTATTEANFCLHFFNRNYTHRLHLEEDGSVPSYYRACGIFVSLHSLQRGHLGGKHCKANIRRNRQRERNEVAAGAQARAFTIDDYVLKKVENFKYLGRHISSRDSDSRQYYESFQGAKALFSHL